MMAWLRRRAENIAALLLAVMFAAFIVQIVFRYVFNFPVGWAAELTVATWLWLVLFGSAFVLSEKEEIRFDLIYSAVRPRVRIGMAIVSALAIIARYVWLLSRLMRGSDPEAGDVTKVSSGL